MKIVKRIIWSLLLICLLFLITLAGAFALGYADGKKECPPPPCVEKTTEISTHR